MKDVYIAKEHLIKNNLNLVLVKDGEVVEESAARGIKPIFEVYNNRPEKFIGASVADRVIGKAAALFLVNGKIKSLYTDLISEVAYDILIDSKIEVSYKIKVPMILNRTGDDMCPIEKLSSNTDDFNKIIEDIKAFLINIKAN